MCTFGKSHPSSDQELEELNLLLFIGDESETDSSITNPQNAAPS